MSKSLSLFIEGCRILSQAFGKMAEELGEGVQLVSASEAKAIKTAETKKEAVKEPVKETKAEAAPEIDEAKLREECTAIVKKKVVLPGKKAEILAALKAVGADKVTSCPVEKLPELKAALEAIKA